MWLCISSTTLGEDKPDISLYCMHHLNYTYTVEAAQWTADKLKYINLIWKYVLGTNVLTVDGSLTVFFFFSDDRHQSADHQDPTGPHPSSHCSRKYLRQCNTWPSSPTWVWQKSCLQVGFHGTSCGNSKSTSCSWISNIYTTNILN